MLNKLGKYEIRRKLGGGAMGVVYEGFDPFIERPVAIKTIQKSLIEKSDAAEVLGRFRREAQAAGRLSHPNIVSVYEYGEEGEVAFIAMEFIAGTELKDRFDETTKLEVSDSINIMAQLLDALDYSHRHGVVHRDIKPSNILITKDGQVKIADFGIAKIESSDLTQVGTVMGTPSYMSPEQFMGQPVDNRTDLYSSGILLYQLLTGERPFTGSNMTEIMNKVVNEVPPQVSRLNPDLPKAMYKVIEKAIAKRPEDRFQTATEFMRALELALDSTLTLMRTPFNEAAIKTPSSRQNFPKINDATNLIAEFNPDEIEVRLKELQLDANRKSLKSIDEQSDDLLRRINQEFNLFASRHESKIHVDAASQTLATPISFSTNGSTFKKEAEGSQLLAGLAQEAKEKQGSRQSTLQESQARARYTDVALNRIIKFFNLFIKHVNEVKPEINRAYHFDARTVYSRLTWHDAVIEYRKQSLSDAALMDYVTLNINLCAPGPVQIKRPWAPLDTLKKELQYLGLRMMEHEEMASNNPKREWLEAQLAPNFPVQIKFQGNYEKGNINVTCRNVETFGIATYDLAAEDVTLQFLDGMGLFLLGRTEKLPSQLKPMQSQKT